jgi:hypothetical protein
MLKIGVLGADNDLGNAITLYLDIFEDKYEVYPITFSNYQIMRDIDYDIFINCLIEDESLLEDDCDLCTFHRIVGETNTSFYSFKFKKYIYFSSTKVNSNDIQGFYHRLAEMIILRLNNNALILRKEEGVSFNTPSNTMIAELIPNFIDDDRRGFIYPSNYIF